MKKHKIYGVVFSLVCAFILFGSINVYAADTCDDFDKYFTITSDVDVTYKDAGYNAVNGTYTIYINKIKNKKIDLKGAKIIKSGSEKEDGTIDLLESNKLVFNTSSKGILNISISFVMPATTKVCNKKIEIILPKKHNIGTVSNTSYDNVCAFIRNKTYNSKYFSGISEDTFNRYILSGNASNDIKYCYSSQVTVNLNDDTVISLIKSAINKWALKNLSSSKSDPDFDALWKLAEDSGHVVTDTDLSGSKLKCDAFRTNTTGGYYVNVDYYAKSTSSATSKVIGKSTVSCKKTCKEVVKIQYGPPVVAKAGLCFEYKVKVESKVNCSSEIEGDAPNPDDYKYHTPVPVCNDSEQFHDQGGPSEDFDSCIDSCDNGSYTQSCINKCYKKVYGSISGTKKLALDYILSPNVASQLSNDSCGSRNEQNIDADKLSSKILSSNGGKYVRADDGTINWENNSGCFWDGLGRYYFEDVDDAGRSLSLISGNSYTDANGRVFGANPGDYYVIRYGDNSFDTSSWNVYNAVNNNKKSYYGKSYNGLRGFMGTTGCTNSCHWEDSEENAEFLNPKDAADAYQIAVDEYNDFVNGCYASADICSTSTEDYTVTSGLDKDESKYTISIDNKLKNGTFDKKWTSTFKHKADASGDSLILLDRGGCYGDGSTTFDFMTEWSFPGTWINNKTGEISYDSSKEKDNKWHSEKGKFCTSLNSASTNVKWYHTQVTDKNYNICSTATTSQAEIERDLEYNINATVRNFGYYHWNFDMSCFYGLDTTTYTPKTSSTSSVTCDEKEANYSFRSVTTDDLFPGSLSGLTGRQVGYNWSDNAINLNNPDYQINPTKLIDEIQKRTDLYSEDKNSEYLDYEFVLDKAALKAIQSFNDSKNNKTSTVDTRYSGYTGKVYLKNGVEVYSSDLFRNGGVISDTAKKLGVIGCNNQSGNGEQCESYTW